MNRRAVVSINRMRVAHYSLEASLSRFTLWTRQNANAVTGCKRSNVFSGTVNSTRTKGE
jgi:hypothetical protein